MSEQSYCAYEHCQRPLEVKPGHRRKEYCDGNCRQAAHRLREEREQAAKKANLDYYLTKYHSARLRPILEHVLREQGANDLLRLVTAIDEECGHAQASDAMQKRVAYLEIQLSEYRTLIDLEDREKIGQQFMSVGQLLDYRALDKFRIGQGIERWDDYRSWTHEQTLAEVIIYGREVLTQETAVREKSQLRQLEQRIMELERELEGKRTLLSEESTEHQLIKDLQAVRVNVAAPDLLTTLYGQALLLVKEREQEVSHLKTRIEKQYERKLTKQQRRIQELEAGQAEWTVWKEAKTRGCGDLVAMRQYLQEHEQDLIPIQRNGVTVRIVALGEDAVAVTESHGLLRLNDEELQQGRVWVCKRKGVPVIATRLPIGETAAEGKHRLQVERDLEGAHCEIRALQLELAKYLAPPRELLECSLRVWSTRTNLFYIDDMETFIRNASDRRLLKEIASARDCYFIGKQNQRRIGIIADAIKRGDELLYEGDKDLVLTSIDEQGYVTFASGGRTWLDIDAVRQLWALVVAERGQCHVGSNVEVAHLQQYLHDHPEESISIQQGKKEYQVVLVDDDALAVTSRHRPLRLYDDGLERAHAWINSKRDEKMK